MEHKLFRTKFQLWDYLQHKVKGVDLNTTLRMPIFWIAMEDGEMHKNRSAKQFAECFNKLFDCNINPKLSYRSRQSCVLFFGGVEEDVVETPVAETIAEEVTEPLISLDAEIKDIVEDVKEGVDWDKIWSFKDDKAKRQSKDDLEKYCMQEFDIDLRKNQSFEDMVEELKEKIGE